MPFVVPVSLTWPARLRFQYRYIRLLRSVHATSVLRYGSKAVPSGAQVVGEGALEYLTRAQERLPLHSKLDSNDIFKPLRLHRLIRHHPPRNATI